MSATEGEEVLNAGEQTQKSEVSAVELSKRLQKLMLKIEGSFITEEGRAVDYNALKDSALFKEYVEGTQALKTVNLESLDGAEKIAFFLNIYNSLTIHGLAMCESGLPNSVLEIKSFWRKTSYNIGGQKFSLDDIEHGILRGNRPHPADGKPLFMEDDPRLEFTVKEVDPRIHFALVCGAKSCPAIRVFSGENLERGLDAAAKNFCSQEVCVDNNMIILSRIFMWYKTDFGSTDRECLSWISHHLGKDEQQKLKSLLEVADSDSSINITYSEYNWNLNGSKL